MQAASISRTEGPDRAEIHNPTAEGSAAAAYLHLLADTVPEEFRFDGRSRRPPRGPINTLLSFRQLFRRQAQRLARTIQDGEAYRAFRFPA